LELEWALTKIGALGFKEKFPQIGKEKFAALGRGLKPYPGSTLPKEGLSLDLNIPE